MPKWVQKYSLNTSLQLRIEWETLLNLCSPERGILSFANWKKTESSIRADFVLTVLPITTLTNRIPTYKSLLCLWISPYARGAWVWIAGSIGTHPHFSSLAIWGSPLLLSHSAQTTYSSQSSVVGLARILWSILRAPRPACHAWREGEGWKRTERT